MTPAARSYLDHNATSPLRPEARAAMLDVLDAPGNASSVHGEGRAARARLEQARGAVAALFGAPKSGVVFTSGATEANALALTPALEIAGKPVRCDVLLASAVEHPSVMRGHRYPDGAVEWLPVDGEGLLRLDALEDTLARHRAAGRTALVSVMAANNETGVIQPLAEIGRIAHAHGAVVHCDAVQAAGRIALDMDAFGLDMVTLSSHKLGGPQGAGALVVRHPDTRAATPLIGGGGQERSRRGGTENVAAIVGFGAAAACVRQGLEPEAARLADLRTRFETGLRARFPDAAVAGAGAPRLPNTICAMFGRIRAETLVIALDLSHVSVSAGSACSSGKVAASHVLSAMGIEADLAAGAIRLSLGWSSTERDVDAALDALEKAVPALRARGARAA